MCSTRLHYQCIYIDEALAFQDDDFCVTQISSWIVNVLFVCFKRFCVNILKWFSSLIFYSNFWTVWKMIRFRKFVSFNSWSYCIQLFNSSSLHESFNFSHSEWLVFFDVRFQTRSSDVDVERIDYNLWEGIHRPLLSLKNDVRWRWIRL